MRVQDRGPRGRRASGSQARVHRDGAQLGHTRGPGALSAGEILTEKS